jgi:hypothetical protein
MRVTSEEIEEDERESLPYSAKSVTNGLRPAVGHQIGNFGLLLLWCVLHFLVNVWYFLLEIVHAVEGYFISSGLLKRYEALNLGKLRYPAIVVGSEEAYQTSEMTKLLQWLETIGVKHVCLYDTEGETHACMQLLFCK